MIGWREEDTSERINCADTVKVQWSAALVEGARDPVGHGTGLRVAGRGHQRRARSPGRAARRRRRRLPPTARPSRNTHENFLAAAAKLGLGLRDIPPCVTFFAPVSLDAEGRFLWNASRKRPGDFVDLRAEMNVVAGAVELRPSARSGSARGIRTGHADPSSRAAPRLPTIPAGPLSPEIDPRLRVHGPALRLRSDDDDQPRSHIAARHVARVIRAGCSGRAAMVADSEARTDVAHHRQRRPAGRRCAAVLRRRSGRALQRAGHAAGPGLGLYRARNAAGFEPGPGDGAASPPIPAADTIRRRAAAPAKATPSASAKPTKYQHACRENFILELSKYGLTKRDIVANLNFFMNVPIDPSGQFHRRRRHLGARQLCRHHGGDGCDLRHLQLSAGQQSLQRLQSDADPRADLGRARGVSAGAGIPNTGTYGPTHLTLRGQRRAIPGFGECLPLSIRHSWPGTPGQGHGQCQGKLVLNSAFSQILRRLVAAPDARNSHPE